MNYRQNNTLLNRFNQVNSMRSIQNNPLLSQVNRRAPQSQKVNDPTRIREAILDQHKIDPKIDVSKFNRIVDNLGSVRGPERDKLWASRTNQPYKTIMPPESIKKEYKSADELVVYKVNSNDKDTCKFNENASKLQNAIKIHNKELSDKFSILKKKNYEDEFEYNTVLKYKIKYDPANFEDMKGDITEFYKKEQQEIEQNKKHVDEIIEGMLDVGDNGNMNNNIPQFPDEASRPTEEKEETVSTSKYLQRQKKV